MQLRGAQEVRWCANAPETVWGLRKTSRCTTALAALQRQGRRRALDGPQMAAGSPPVGEGRFPEQIWASRETSRSAGSARTRRHCRPRQLSAGRFIFASHLDEINPPVGQRRRSGGFEAGLGEDAVDRALTDLESSGDLDPGVAGDSELDY